MKHDNEQGNDDKEIDFFPFFRMTQNYMNHEIYNFRQELIGNLNIQNSSVSWESSADKMTYYLSVQDLENIIREHCKTAASKAAEDDYFRQYAPMLNPRSIRAEDLTPEQRQRLMQLNERLTRIERQLKADVMPQLQQLSGNKQYASDDVQDCYCDIALTFGVGPSDRFYDEEDSENRLIRLTETPDHPMLDDGVNHNEYQHWEGHPMRAEFHCWLYHCLYDHTHIGWVNMLRIEDVWVDVTFTVDKGTVTL